MGAKLLMLIVATAVVLGAPASIAVARAVSPTESAAVACPLQSGSVFPCCGPPVADAGTTTCCAADPGGCCPIAPTPADVATVCCPATAACPETALTIDVSPSQVRAGSPVTISGVLSGGSGATVTLWGAPTGGSDFQQLATTTVDSSGAYSFARAAGSVLTNSSWYVTSGSARSATVAQSVSARVTIAPGPVSFAVGRRATVSGAVSPGHAGQQVLLLRRVGGDWNVVARARLSAASRFVLRRRFDRGGLVRLRVELPGDSRNVQSFSRVVSLTIARRA